MEDIHSWWNRQLVNSGKPRIVELTDKTGNATLFIQQEKRFKDKTIILQKDDQPEWFKKHCEDNDKQFELIHKELRKIKTEEPEWFKKHCEDNERQFASFNKMFKKHCEDNERQFEIINKRLERLETEEPEWFKKHCEDNNRQFEAINKRFDKLEQLVVKGFELVNLRIDKLEKRVDNLESMIRYVAKKANVDLSNWK